MPGKTLSFSARIGASLKRLHSRGGGAPKGTKQQPFTRFGIKEQILFAKRLSMMLTSGIPILQGLRMLEEGVSSRSSRFIMGALGDSVAKGVPLSDALKRFERIFGAFAINIVHVGETTGTLPENLNYIAHELRKKHDLTKKIVGALIYPAIIVLATVGITVMLIVYIFPKILPIFMSLKSELPLSTRSLIALSGFLSHYGLILFGAIVLISIMHMVYMRNFVSYRLVVNRIILKIPVFGAISRDYNLANISRTLSLLLKSDVRIVQALEIGGNSLKNEAYRRAMRHVGEGVLHGQLLSSQLRKEGNLFPPLFVQMVAVGEATGNLSESLMYLSDMYESEINDVTKNLSTILEPVLMLVMGIIVGFIAISIITPIYGITQNLHH